MNGAKVYENAVSVSLLSISCNTWCSSMLSIEKVGALELDLKVNNCCLVSES